MLILLRQTPTGIYAYPPEIPENEIFDAVYFDTVTKTIFTSGTVGGGSFEMATGQFVWTDPSNGDTYTYDGDGDVILTPGTGPAPAETFTLTLETSPKGSTLPILVADPAGPHEEGDEVAISILPAAGWEFVMWKNGSEPITDLADFTFTMPAGNVVLTAHFNLVEEPPLPGAEPPSAPLPSGFVFPTFFPLEIRVNGAQIPIPSITTVTDTGIFTDELQGDYHYPITIPITEAVMVALNLPNDPQSAWEFSQPINAELWAHGNRRYRGHLDVIDADEKAIRATFVLDSGFFIQQNKTRSIQDCYAEDDIILVDPPKAAVGGHELRFNFRDVRLTVNGTAKLFLKASYEDHITMLEAMADYLEGLPVNLLVSIQYSEDLTDESSRIILWDTTTVTTITLEVTTGTSRYTRARRLTNTRFIMDEWATVDEENRIAFPTIYNKELYEGNNPLHDGIVNRYDSQGRLQVGNIALFSFSEAFRWENTVIPFLYLTDVVKTIFRKLNIEVSGSFFDDDRVKRMLLYNNRTLDFVQITQSGTPIRRIFANIIYGDNFPEQDQYRYQNVHDWEIKLRNHVPDVGIIDFLKAMKNYFFLKYDFNILQNRVEIRFVRDLIRSMEVIDMTAKAGRVYTLTHGKEEGINIVYATKDPILEDGSRRGLPNAQFNVNNFLALDSLDAELDEIAFVRSLRAYFRLTANQENPPFWKLEAFQMQDDTAANRRTWTVAMVPLVDAFVDGRKMPSIEMTGYNSDLNLFNKETGIRIFAFYGVKSDAANRPYHFASSTRYNAKELLDPAQYDLDLRSEDSYRFFQDLENMLDRGKEYECTLLLSDLDLGNLSKTRRIRIANIDYLIDKLEILHTEGEFAIGKAKMWKVRFTKPQNRTDAFASSFKVFDDTFDDTFE